VSDLLHAERQEAVQPLEVEGAEAEQLEHDAHVTPQVEPVQHPHTGTGRRESRGGRGYNKSFIIAKILEEKIFTGEHFDISLLRKAEKLTIFSMYLVRNVYINQAMRDI